MSDARNGIRQPQSAKVSLPSHFSTPMTTKMAMKRPRVAVIWMKLV